MKFSIGIPAYKAKFLKECVESILNQTYTDFELIIVNDASPENLDEIVLKFSDSRIRYYVNEINCGAENVVDNWNKCLEYSNGEFFILMGDDDIMHYNYLEEFERLIKKYPDLDIYHIPSPIFKFIYMAVDISKADWMKIVKRGYVNVDFEKMNEKEYRNKPNLVYNYLLDSKSIIKFFLKSFYQRITATTKNLFIKTLSF